MPELGIIELFMIRNMIMPSVHKPPRCEAQPINSVQTPRVGIAHSDPFICQTSNPILPTLLSLYVNIRRDSDFITQHHFCRAALPAPISGSADKKGAAGIDIKLRDDASSMAGDNQEWYNRMPTTGLFLSVEIVETEDVVGCAVEVCQCILIPRSIETIRVDKQAHHIKCFPFGIALTLLTLPLPAGNRNVLLGPSLNPRCRLYSSTLLFLLPV